MGKFKNRKSRDVVTIPFCKWLSSTVTMVAGVNTTTIPVDPSLTVQLNAVAAQYELYRVRSLRVKLYAPGVMTSGTGDENVDVVVGFMPGSTSTAPATATQVGAFLHHVGNGARSLPTTSTEFSVPYCSTVQTMTVPSRVLMEDTANRWYKTQASASVEGFSETQGFLYLVCDSDVSSTADVGWTIEYSGVAEFTGMINTTQNPLLPSIEDRDRRPPKKTPTPGHPVTGSGCRKA